MDLTPIKSIPLHVEQIFFPCYSQLVVVPSGRINYGYSLWIGLSTPILNLPRMMWAFMLRPIFYGTILIVSLFATSLIAGVAGRAAGIRVIAGDKNGSETDASGV